jgi:hypothetical protein
LTAQSVEAGGQKASRNLPGTSDFMRICFCSCSRVQAGAMQNIQDKYLTANSTPNSLIGQVRDNFAGLNQTTEEAIPNEIRDTKRLKPHGR